MNRCQICGVESEYIPQTISICRECIIKSPKQSLMIVTERRKQFRKEWGLRTEINHSSEGIQCSLCSNSCKIAEGEKGFCGIYQNIDNHLTPVSGSRREALLHTYLDPLPTNCCNTWFCPAGTGKGLSYRKNEPEYGYYNLACFLYGCNFDCFGCQNPSHKQIRQAPHYSIEKFVKTAIDPKVSCICWFGGSPEPQLPWALRASREVLKQITKQPSSERRTIKRICWEWNGAGNPKLVQQAVKLSLKSGGNAKFDLKYAFFDLSRIISGVSNEQSFKNFELCFKKFYHQREEPVLAATTLLIPGYVNEEEVEKIAQFIADLDPSIPYSLLIFFPALYLQDLSVTPKKQVSACLKVAKQYLENVHLGNKNLLGMDKIIF